MQSLPFLWGTYIITHFEEKFKGVRKKSSKILKKPIDKFKTGCYNIDKFKRIEPNNNEQSRCNGKQMKG